MQTETFDMYVMLVANELMWDGEFENELVGKAVDILKDELKREYDAGNNVRHAAEMVDDYIVSELL
jgi:hypothetical protein